MTHIVALVDDLMDRSRITAVEPSAVTTRSIDDVADAGIVVVDLGKHVDALADVRGLAPDAFIVAFGRHDDTATLEAARGAGADRVLTRARFFADVAAAIDPSADGEPSEPQPSDQ